MTEESVELNGQANGERKHGSESPKDSGGFDSVFNYVGGSGIYQWILLGIVAIQGYTLVNHHVGFVFLGAEPDHWCMVAELSGSNWTVEEIKSISIPLEPTEDGSTKFSQCLMYDLNYTELLKNHQSFQDAYKSLNLTVASNKSCQQWNYDQTYFESTVVTDFNLVCEDHHYVATITSFYTIGTIIGAITGPLSDKVLGRRNTILMSVVLMVLCGYGAAFAKSYLLFSICRFFLGFGNTGCYNNCFILLLEYSDKKCRSLLGVIQMLAYAFGYMTLALFGYCFRSWNELQLAFATFTLVILSYFWILPESARWLASQGRDNEAVKYLRKVAHRNKREMPSGEILTPLLKSCREDQDEDLSKDEKWFRRLWRHLCSMTISVLNLVIRPELRLRTLAVWALFICANLAYYGAIFDSTTVTVDPYLVVFLGGLTEIPAFLWTPPMATYWGRKPTLMLFFALAAVSNLVFILLPDGQAALEITVALLGKLFVSSAFAVIYLLGAEVYPTSVRTTGMGAAVLVGPVGGVIASYAFALLGPIHLRLPTAVFGVTELLAIGAVLLLPEMKDLGMEDAIANRTERIRRSSDSNEEVDAL